MPTSTHTTPGDYIASELIAAKARGESFKRPQLSAFIDVCLEHWAQAKDAIPATQKAELSPAEAIYAAYPRKVGKKAALKAITTAIREDTIAGAGAEGKANAAASLLAATKSFADSVATWPAKDRPFIPHASTWFNRGSYLDDPKEWQRTGSDPINAGPRNYDKI